MMAQLLESLLVTQEILGDMDGVLGTRLHPAPTLTAAGIWGVTSKLKSTRSRALSQPFK